MLVGGRSGDAGQRREDGKGPRLPGGGIEAPGPARLFTLGENPLCIIASYLTAPEVLTLASLRWVSHLWWLWCLACLEGCVAA
jgi:hypothetical protein